MAESDLQQQSENSTIRVYSDSQSVLLPLNPNLSLREALDMTTLRTRAACGGLGSCGACLIRIVSGRFNPPTLAERQRIRPDDLANGVRLACQLRPLGGGELYLQHPAPGSDWKSLDASRLCRASGNPGITDHVYGVAVDLGTTHIRLSLWNRQSGRCIGSRYSTNPQAAHGADVLTRLDADRAGMEQLARHAIIAGIRDILTRDVGEVSPMLDKIGNVLIVGNTAMLSLICGNNSDSLHEPENWQRPIACIPDDINAWRNAWRMPHADITIVQPLAGFIGSDLLADLVATGIADQTQPALLADFGTNTEIALWDGQVVWVTSVPGGPAFEGAGIRNGVAAETGAICNVDQDNGQWRLETLGQTPARGFCGSGFIDAVALLLDEKLLKPSGRFAESRPDGYRLDADNPCTAIYPADIDVFQRAKASTAAAMMQLLAFAGLQADDLDTLWICGSFGQYLNLDSAMRVGLLPAVKQHRILADAGLAGCEKLLLEQGSEALLNSAVGRIRTVNLGGLLQYEQRFIDNLRLQPVL